MAEDLITFYHTWYLFIPICTLIGCILNRMRGGGYEDTLLDLPKGSDQFMLGLLSAFIAFPLLGLWSLLLIPIIVLVYSIGWGPVFDMGRNPLGYLDYQNGRMGGWYVVLDFIFGKETKSWSFKRRWIRDAFGMLLRGLMISVPIGLLFILLGYPNWIIYIGLLFPVCYELGARTQYAPITYAEYYWGFIYHLLLCYYIWYQI